MNIDVCVGGEEQVALHQVQPEVCIIEIIRQKESSQRVLFPCSHADKNERKNSLMYKEIQNGSVAKSFMTNDLLSPSHMVKYLRRSSYTF